jgi:hypothetical protein
MNNFTGSAEQDRVQAPARRFGGCVAIVVILGGCLCMSGLWYLLAGDNVDILQTSWHLQSNGATTTGTIVDLEEYSGVSPISNSTFKFFVDFVVDGKTYTIKSNSYYPTKGTGWIGKSMPVIYDPENPNSAQLDTFKERWLGPILSILPFRMSLKKGS